MVYKAMFFTLQLQTRPSAEKETLAKTYICVLGLLKNLLMLTNMHTVALKTVHSFAEMSGFCDLNNNITNQFNMFSTLEMKLFLHYSTKKKKNKSSRIRKK